MSVSPTDNVSSCSQCREKYEDQVIGKHPLTGEALCPVCAEDMRCKVCGHVECEGVLVSGICMSCESCDLYEIKGAA